MTIFDLSQVFSRIRVRGADRIDFLHRMSTGNLLGMQPGEGRTTVFTTPIGRMVDYAAVLASEDSLLLVSGGNGQGKLVRWLRKYIFFKDDVQLADESTSSYMIGCYGQDALGQESLAGMPPYAHKLVEAGTIVNAPPLQEPGYYRIGATLEHQKQETAPLSSYEDQRIRAGYPAFPNEINEEHIPLEAGLLNAVSFTKGCYIGQEIIARMESRKQLAKKLVLIEADKAMKVGGVIRADDQTVGAVTSATSDGHIALGYVRSQYAQTGQVIVVGEGAARVVGFAGMV
jgi:tRNA-modifying protein YgfZ